MEKKNFYLLLFLIILLFSIFLVLIYLDANQRSNTQKEKSLNLGQESSFQEPQVYFCPEDNCQTIVVDLIKNSRQTIDCAVYDITSREVTDALIEESNQGVTIRIVTDKGRSQTKTTLVGDLKSAGINVLISPTIESYMHNKFCVFDDTFSLIGSTNFTQNSFSESYNNILVFKNKKIANTLTEKMDSFYLGNFSNSSNILGKTIDENLSIYFCPNDSCKDQILSNISSAKQSISCMMYSFTLDDFADEMVKAKERGVDVKVILETQQTNQYSEFEKLKANGVSVIEDNDPFLMHNKYCVFDGEVLATGSMNFSVNGTNNNDETLVIIKDQNLSNQYINNFYKHWKVWDIQAN